MTRSNVLTRLIVVVGLVSGSLALGNGPVVAGAPSILTTSYNTGGGSIVDATLTSVGGTVADPGVPTLDGYTFRGWTLGDTPISIATGAYHSCA